MPLINQKRGKLEYVTSQLIDVPHCFSTRLGGVSKGYLESMNLGIHRGDLPENVAENYRILGEAVGFSPEDVVAPRQIHSDIVLRVGREDCGKYLTWGASPECDALISNEPGVTLAVFTADCTPILLQDPVTGAVGAIHAGWRGTVADIAGKTVKAMQDVFGTDPADLRAAIGPNIGQCCFETDEDVPRGLRDALGVDAEQFILQKKDKYFLDLKGANEALLRRAGVRQIEKSCECTFCAPDRFWSHRRHGAERGSMAAMIVVAKEDGK